MDGVASSAISARGMMPRLSREMTKYRTNTPTKPMAAARPTSFAYFALPDTTTDASMPVNTHTRAIMVETTCVPKSGPPGSPQKLSMNQEKSLEILPAGYEGIIKR